MEYTLAEQLPPVLEDKTAISDYVDVYQPASTSLPSPALSWPSLILPWDLDSRWRRALERLADPLYGRDLLDMRLREMALGAPDITEIWRITEKLPSLTDLLNEERENE